jgi:hypothetical protein
MTAVSILTALLVLLPVGAILAGVRTRVHFARTDGAFRCKIRAPYDRLTDIRPQWPRCRTRARWVNDVLLIEHGLLRPRTLALPGRIPDDVIRQANTWEVTGLGVDPVVLVLQLDNGSIAEIAARHRDGRLLVGPFLAAAIPHRPGTTADQGRRGR